MKSLYVVFERWDKSHSWQELKTYPTLQQAKKSIWDIDLVAIESKNKDAIYYKFPIGKELKIVKTQEQEKTKNKNKKKKAA